MNNMAHFPDGVGTFNLGNVCHGEIFIVEGPILKPHVNSSNSEAILSEHAVIHIDLGRSRHNLKINIHVDVASN